MHLRRRESSGLILAILLLLLAGMPGVVRGQDATGKEIAAKVIESTPAKTTTPWEVTVGDPVG